jgi:hypothetical protein
VLPLPHHLPTGRPLDLHPERVKVVFDQTQITVVPPTDLPLPRVPESPFEEERRNQFARQQPLAVLGLGMAVA